MIGNKIGCEYNTYSTFYTWLSLLLLLLLLLLLTCVWKIANEPRICVESVLSPNSNCDSSNNKKRVTSNFRLG
jgi:hypothetical protein